MPDGMPITLALPDDELPDVTDAGVGLTLMMVASLMADRERQALTARVADAVEAQDWTAVAALTRRLAAVPGAVSRMADVARAGIERYDAGMADPGETPADGARNRRALVRAANFLDRRFWPMFGTVRPVMPPAAAEPAAPPPSCGDILLDRLAMLDRQLAALTPDDRPTTLTARRIMTADRNARSAECRHCDGCPVSRSPITDPLPLL